jgi:uncharacterized protein YdeI (YjbR/CyaY-like superfamily)
MPNHDPRVDDYIAKARDFARPILEHVRTIVHEACPQVEETIKWGMPTFMYRGRNLAHLAAFKAHCAFGFWHGRQVVSSAREREAMGQFGRVGSIRDLPGRRELKALVRKAAALIDAGVKPSTRTARVRRPPPVVPPDLRARLARNAAARRHFESFPPSRRREYVDWITGAKRDDTRKRRLDQAIRWLSAGKPHNWQYMG